MKKLVLYTLCAVLLLVGFFYDYKKYSKKSHLSYSVSSISKATFLKSIPNKSTLMLGFSTDGRTKSRKIFHLQKIGFDSLKVMTNDRLYFEEPDIAYMMKFYRNELVLTDISQVQLSKFIDYVNTADSFSALKEQGAIIGQLNEFTSNSPTYSDHLLLYIKYYGLYCFFFFLVLIGNRRFMPANESRGIFFLFMVFYSIGIIRQHGNKLKLLSENSFGDKVGMLNFYETQQAQNWVFLLVFITVVVIFYSTIANKIKQSNNYYEFVFIYFFSSLMICFTLMDLSTEMYFTNTYQTTGYSYRMAFFAAFPLSICIPIGLFLTDKFRLSPTNIIDKLKERALQSEAELTALQASVNPHFLYNSLNSITALVDKDPEKTKEMSLALSNFYKYTTNREEKSIASVGEEIEMIQNYMIIEMIRFGDRLQFEIDVDESAKTHIIPYFLLQPIIENSIKYGYNGSQDKINILLKIAATNDDLHIQIFDSGKEFDTQMQQGYGLRNTTQKLKLLYPDEHSIEFVNQPKHVSVIIKLNAHV